MHKSNRHSFLKNSGFAGAGLATGAIALNELSPRTWREEMFFEPNHSYWARSQPTQNPALAENLEVDVAIIGGGFTGLSTALIATGWSEPVPGRVTPAVDHRLFTAHPVTRLYIQEELGYRSQVLPPFVTGCFSSKSIHWNLGARGISDAGTRFAQGCKALALHPLYYLNN